MLIPEKRPSSEEKALLAHFRALPMAERDSLLAFAEFLAARAAGQQDGKPPEVVEPVPVEAPENESVVAAIKRLSSTYPMLERAVLLNETSVLMTAHVMQGRGADEVIAELEALFSAQYEIYKKTQQSSD